MRAKKHRTDWKKDWSGDDIIWPGDVFVPHDRVLGLLVESRTKPMEPVNKWEEIPKGENPKQISTVCSLCGRTIKQAAKGFFIETVDGVVVAKRGHDRPGESVKYVLGGVGDVGLWPVGGKCVNKVHPAVLTWPIHYFA